MMNNDVREKELKNNEVKEVVEMVEETVIEIVGWYMDIDGLRVPKTIHRTVLVPAKK